MDSRAADAPLPLDRIKLPPGFAIEVLARVPDARAMTWGDKGTLFVGSTSAGKVYALKLKEGTPPEQHVIASGLSIPLGVAFKGGALYVSSVNRILRFDDVEAHLDAPPKGVAIKDDLPPERHHGGRYLAFGPDGKLYLNIGAPCNVCEPGERYAGLFRMNADGSGFESYARGVRNSVGFDWDPQDKSLWFTDNGRDMLGDDLPADELNHAPKAGMNFGFPYCHQGDTPDPEFGSKHNCGEFTPPAAKMGAHVANLGMRFYTGKQFPAQYRNAIFIAEHGSWNRSRKIGYRVATVRVDNGKVVSNEIFAEGWLQGEQAWGRPVDVLVAPDGALLVSDDQAGAIYRIRYAGGK